MIHRASGKRLLASRKKEMPSPSCPWMGDTMKSGRILRTLHFAIVSRAPLNDAQVRTVAPSDAKRAWAASLAARFVSTTRTLEPRRRPSAPRRLPAFGSLQPVAQPLQAEIQRQRNPDGFREAIGDLLAEARVVARHQAVADHDRVGCFRLLRDELQDLPGLFDRTADGYSVRGPQEILRYGNAPRRNALNHQDVHLCPLVFDRRFRRLPSEKKT